MPDVFCICNSPKKLSMVDLFSSKLQSILAVSVSFLGLLVFGGLSTKLFPGLSDSSLTLLEFNALPSSTFIERKVSFPFSIVFLLGAVR